MNVIMKRVLVSLFFIPLIILALFNGGILLLIFLLLITLLSTWELRNMLGNKMPAVPLIIIPLNGLFLFVFTLMGNDGFLLCIVLVFCTIALNDVLFNRIENAIIRISLSFFIVFYIAYTLSFAYHISKIEGGNYLLVSLIIIIWTTDTFAYFFGTALGRHRGYFKVSPNKSVEGFIFGFLAAVASSFILYHIFYEHYSLYQGIALGLTAGIFGQLGDLCESLFKRDSGVKDSSTIIPGHGGVLDRFDSFIISLPVFYLVNTLISSI